MQRWLLPIAVVLLLAAVAGGASWATAQLQQDDPVKACVAVQTGLARIVADATECRANERYLEWNREGVAGPPGPPGPGMTSWDVDGLACTTRARTGEIVDVGDSYKVNLQCITRDDADVAGDNGTAATATELVVGPDPEGPGGPPHWTAGRDPTLFAAGDHDWYRVTYQVPSGQSMYIGTGARTVETTFEIYMDGTDATNLLNKTIERPLENWTTPYVVRGDGSVHTYYIHVYAATAQLGVYALAGDIYPW